MREKIHRVVLEKLPWRRFSTGRAPVSMRFRCGSKRGASRPAPVLPTAPKYHLFADRNDLPLHLLASAANVQDSRLFEPLMETTPEVHGQRGRPGRPRRSPAKLHADKSLCPTGVPSLPAPAGHHSPNHPARDRGQDPLGPAQMGRGTHLLLGAEVRAPRAALRRLAATCSCYSCSLSRSSTFTNRARRPRHETGCEPRWGKRGHPYPDGVNKPHSHGCSSPYKSAYQIGGSDIFRGQMRGRGLGPRLAAPNLHRLPNPGRRPVDQCGRAGHTGGKGLRDVPGQPLSAFEKT